MILTASRRFAALGEHGIRVGARGHRLILALRTSEFSLSRCVSTAATDDCDDLTHNRHALGSSAFRILSSIEDDFISDVNHHEFLLRLPQPAVAIAPDYYYYDDENDQSYPHDSGALASLHAAPSAGSSSGSTPTTRPPAAASHPYPPPTEYEGKTVESRKHGGGGGGGRCRCPKCGTFVTFRHGDFDENTFYCAACSGWFVMSPHAMRAVQEDAAAAAAFDGGQHFEASSSSSAASLMDKSIHRKALDEPPQQVIMRHFPENPKVYSSRTRPEIIEDARKILEQQAEAEASAAHGGGGMEIKKMPTPRQIMAKLNEYVIGQRDVKVALSVGVYNHYKRIFVAESQAAANQRRAEVEEGFIPVNTDGPKLSDLNLGQFGSATVKESANGKPFCETPDINSITDASFGRDVEDVEIDKSNILLLGTSRGCYDHVH